MNARSRPLVQALLVAVLLLGGAAHALYHLSDSGCETSRGAKSVPCVTCQSLGAAAVPDDPAAAASPSRDRGEPVRFLDRGAPASVRITAAPPRAPPVVA